MKTTLGVTHLWCVYFIGLDGVHPLFCNSFIRKKNKELQSHADG